MKTYEIPSEIVVNPQEKLLYITPVLESTFPGASEAFKKVDEAYGADPLAYLRALEASQFSFKSSTSATIDYSLIPGKGTEILVMWAPFSDSAPNSTGYDIWCMTL